MTARPETDGNPLGRIWRGVLFPAVLLIAVAASLYLLFTRIHSTEDLWRTWQPAVLLTVAIIAVLPESLRGDWFARIQGRVIVLVIVLVVLLSAATQTGYRTSARQYFDVTRHEGVLPGETVIFNLNGLPGADRLTVKIRAKDRDPSASTSEFCENQIALVASLDAGTMHEPPKKDGLLHRFTFDLLKSPKDMQLSVSYTTPESVRKCSEDISIESATLE
ncbi:hypothetical protein [Micromonospora sp. WMMD708]|uniref:hypothetical protein n=1 Tax=Micromonospora sp. WMMD708 TaxID=3403464 RepID=UPI003BF4CC0B